MMIQISSKDTLYMYNLYHIVKAFFPNEEISQNLDEKPSQYEIGRAHV